MRGHKKTTLIAIAMALVACTGGYEPPPAAGPGPNPPSPGTGQPGTGQPSLVSCSNSARPDFGPGPGSPGGIWSGVVTLEPDGNTREGQGLVTDDGRYWFWVGFDQWVGSFTVNGTTFSGDGIAYSGGSTWSDGSLVTSVDILGVFSERETLIADWGMGSGNWGCFAVDYDAELYERPSALADMAGTWEQVDDWGYTWRLIIDSAGNFLLQDPYECDMSGRIGIIDAQVALYEVADAGFACRPDEAGYSGLAYTYRSSWATSERDNGIVLLAHNGTRALRYVFSLRQP